MMEFSQSLRQCVPRMNRSGGRIASTVLAHTSRRAYSASQTQKTDDSRPPSSRPRTSIADLLSDPSRPNSESQPLPRRSSPPQTKDEINAKLSTGLANLLGRARRDPQNNRFTRQSSAPDNSATGKSSGDVATADTSRPMSAIEALDTRAIYGSTGLLSRSLNRPDSLAPSRGFNASDSANLFNSIVSPGGGGRMPALLQRPEIHLRLKPVLGRTLAVTPETNFNLTRAFQVLETKINKNGNSVRKDARDQKFHVRKGMKAKIERRERWRLIFKEGFMAEVGRVKRMIRQGW